MFLHNLRHGRRGREAHKGMSASAAPSWSTCTPTLNQASTSVVASSAHVQDHSFFESLSLEDALAFLEKTSHLPPVEDLILTLHKCRKQKTLGLARRAHVHIHAHGLEAHQELGNHLVPMLVECGCMPHAQQVFHRLIRRNVYSWTSLIQGYVDGGEPRHALYLFYRMQEDCVLPNRITFHVIVKACTRLKCMEAGWEIHAEIAREGLEKDPFLGSALVDMYAKCGSLAEAREVFDELSVRDVVTWTALIAGYVEHGLGQEALKCLKRMQLEGMSLDDVTFVCSLKACASIGAIDKGCEIHTEIAKEGFEGDPFVNGTLVDLYAKCGWLPEAQEVFDELPIPNVFSWTALITGYVECGLAEAALNCLQKMQLVGVTPDSVTFLCSLKACGSIGAVDNGRDIHGEVVKEGFESDPFIGNSLVDMYVKCGSFSEACEVFDELATRDVVSWNSLIAGYAEHELGEEVLDCLEQMQLECVTPNAVTFVCILKACSSLGNISKGQEIHALIAKDGIGRDPFVGSTLVEFYAKCGSLAEAQDVFDELPDRSIVSWNALAAGYAELGFGEEVLSCLEKMRLDGLCPGAIMFVFSLKGCVCLGAADKGQEIHSEIVKEEFERDPFVGSSLVDMYAKCGLLVEAQKVFNELHDQDVVSWNALVTGYAEQGHGEEVLKWSEKMQEEGVSLDAITFVCCLKACASLGAIGRGHKFHMETTKRGFESDPSIGSTLVDMYTKCSSPADAQGVFNKLPVRNVISWTALITMYSEQGLNEEAVNCLEKMLSEGVFPDGVTFVCSLKACGNLGAIKKGQEMHCEISKEGFERDSFVGNILVDMYAKCGALEEAKEVFDEVQVRTLVSWSSLMAGYACQGRSKPVFHLFERMSEEGIKPDKVIFLSVLTACSHVGLVDEGHMFFEAISKEYGILPTIEHHNCMIDLLGRAGQLHEAVAMLEIMSLQPDLVTWNTLLGACQKWGHVELARNAFDSMVSLDVRQGSSFISMSNIYADAEM